MSPPVQSSSPFDQAQRKVAAYLRLCGLAPAVAEKTGAALLESAAARAPAATPPTSAALQNIDAWAATLVAPQAGETETHRAVRGFAQMVLAGSPARWPENFLAPAQPAELQAAVAAQGLLPAPELAQTIMKPQPLDLGPVSSFADETWRTFDKWPFLRGLVMWFLFLLMLGAAFYLVRF